MAGVTKNAGDKKAIRDALISDYSNIRMPQDGSCAEAGVSKLLEPDER